MEQENIRRSIEIKYKVLYSLVLQANAQYEK
jgi:hypothetical protein